MGVLRGALGRPLGVLGRSLGVLGEPLGALGRSLGVLGEVLGDPWGALGSSGGPWGDPGVPKGVLGSLGGPLLELLGQREIIEKPPVFIAFSQCGSPGEASERALGSPGVHGEVSWGPGDRLGDPWGALGSPWEALGSHLSPRGDSGGLGEPGRDAVTPNAHICEGFKGPRGGGTRPGSLVF